MIQDDSAYQDQHDQSFVERHQLNQLVFAAGCLVLIFILYQLVAGSITFFLVGSARVTRENVTELRILTMAGQIFFILLPTIFLARLLTPRMWEVFPARIPSLPEMVYALVGLVFLQQIFQIYLFFQDLIPLPDVLQQALDQFKSMIDEMFKGLVSVESIPELALVLVVVAFVPAIVEEMFFRGLIQVSIEKKIGPFRAAMVAGTVFGLYHFNPFALIPLIGLGAYFGYLRYRSRSIVIPMTAHFVNNALAVLAVYFSVNDDLILGADKGTVPEIGTVVVQLVLYIVLFVAAFTAYRRSSAGEQTA